MDVRLSRTPAADNHPVGTSLPRVSAGSCHRFMELASNRSPTTRSLPGFGRRWDKRCLACYFGLGNHHAVDVLASVTSFVPKDYWWTYVMTSQ